MRSSPGASRSDNSARGNRASANAAVTGSAVDNPIFKTKKGGVEDFDVPGMIDAQFDLVYGAPRDASDPAWAPDPNRPVRAHRSCVDPSEHHRIALSAPVIGQAVRGRGHGGG